MPLRTPIPITTRVRRMSADTFTPVGIYLRVRDLFPGSFLLESSDSRGGEGSFSYICFHRLASFEVRGLSARTEFPDGTTAERELSSRREAKEALADFLSSFAAQPLEKSGAVNGIFGYLGYDAVECFEDIALGAPRVSKEEIPGISYALFQYIIAIDHFRDEMLILENEIEGARPCPVPRPLEAVLSQGEFRRTTFRRNGEERSNRTDAEHCEVITRAKHHIFRGDVFQIVPSRRFSLSFEGDDLLAYRALRSLNPSPFLFYFDFGSFRLFGSSPEAQLVTGGGKATICPIAGTYRRSNSEAADLELSKKLLTDPKENAEHIMLVDLARNDLSICCYPVEVEEFRTVQFYSHVIHLASKVSGKIHGGLSPVEVMSATFPAGTLTGAPKHRAMTLLDELEGERRGWFGGCIGFFGFTGESTHAILIRSFLSLNNELHFQAGAGVVADSSPESETEEVANKLMALRRALERAEEGV